MRVLSSRTAEVVLARADEIDADDVTVDCLGGSTPIISGRKAEFWIDQFLRHLACLQNLLAMVDVVEKGIERPDALLDAPARAFAIRPPR